MLSTHGMYLSVLIKLNSVVEIHKIKRKTVNFKTSFKIGLHFRRLWKLINLITMQGTLKLLKTSDNIQYENHPSYS